MRQAASVLFQAQHVCHGGCSMQSKSWPSKKRSFILKALCHHKHCRELGIAPGGKFSDTQLRDKFKTCIRQKKGFEENEAIHNTLG